MPVPDAIDRIASVLSERRTEWEECRAEMSEFGDYSVASALAGMALDEIVFRGPSADAICDALEREYVGASPEDEELLRIGIFEELCVLLRARWSDSGDYEEKKQIVRSALGTNARRWFDEWEAK